MIDVNLTAVRRGFHSPAQSLSNKKLAQKKPRLARGPGLF